MAKNLAMTVSCLLLAGALLASIQFASPNIPGFDGFYHIKMARLTLEEGMPLDFPYLPLTILDSERFSDIHMLLHVFQAPFTWHGDLRRAAKVSSLVFATIAFTLIAMILFRHGIRFPYLWVLLLFALSSDFLYRMAMPRAPVFGVMFMILAFHFIVRRQPLGLAVISTLFVWTYRSFLILIPLVGIGIVTHYLTRKSLEYKLVLALVVGIAIGMIVNPYFPIDLQYFFGDVARKFLSEGFATEVGGEWYTYGTWKLVKVCFGALALFASGVWLTNRNEWKEDPARLYWFLATAFWLVLLMRSRRFVEYFAPSALMFFAFATRSWLRDFSFAQLRRRRSLQLLAVALAVMIGSAIFYNVSVTRRDMRNEPPAYAYRGAARWLMRNTEKDSRVFHTDWDDFPMLFFDNTHNTYIVGLDPDNLRVENPQMFELWRAIASGEVTRPEDEILQTFGAEYAFTDRYHRGFIRVAERSPRMRRVYADAHTLIYQILRQPGG
jgi:hypothetical protein